MHNTNHYVPRVSLVPRLFGGRGKTAWYTLPVHASNCIPNILLHQNLFSKLLHIQLRSPVKLYTVLSREYLAE